jgi:LacI family transcriptional regulator
VAQRSGVSVSTASRALSGSSRVSASTVAKVRAAAEALGYRPNASARALRTARSQFVGLVVTNLFNASFQTIAEVVQREFARRGYQLVLSVTAGDPAAERASLHMLADHSAAGVIVVGSDSQATDELRELAMPTVHLARRPRDPAGDSVLGDEIVGGRSATEHLLEMGHRRIAIIAGPREVQSGRERMQGYWLAMQAAGLPVHDELTLAVPLSPEAGAHAVEALLALPSRRRPTALLVANHEATYGALPAIREKSAAIPADLSVVCYEDSQLARWWHPAITVVDNNARQMGELAARLLLERLDSPDGERDTCREFRVGTRLIERGSVAPCNVRPVASARIGVDGRQFVGQAE